METIIALWGIDEPLYKASLTATVRGKECNTINLLMPVAVRLPTVFP